ncbi:hypothetical protein BpHYR1_023107, partial [Brachionus plicatilis]
KKPRDYKNIKEKKLIIFIIIIGFANGLYKPNYKISCGGLLILVRKHLKIFNCVYYDDFEAISIGIQSSFENLFSFEL